MCKFITIAVFFKNCGVTEIKSGIIGKHHNIYGVNEDSGS